jgi:endonuclease YncB( thermonuclease family)
MSNYSTPRLGWSTPAKVVDVHDGDTVTVEITRQVTVRLANCWAPETGARCGNRHVTNAERERGEQSRDELEKLLGEHNNLVTLFVPTTKDKDTIDAELGLTFGRVVGEIYVGNELVRLGFATAKKV